MEEKKKTSKRYSVEIRERAVRLLREVLKDHASEWGCGCVDIIEDRLFR